MKLLLSLIALFFIPGSAVTCWDGILLLAQWTEFTPWLLIGLGSGLLIYFIALQYWEWFLVFEHELTHALVALLFFRKIKKFVVTSRKGGVVHYTQGFGGEFGNSVITLAPYFLPTFSFFATLFLPLIPIKWAGYFYLFIGFTLIYHFLTALTEIPRNWYKGTFREAGSGKAAISDIAKSGYLFSFIFIIFMTLFIHSLVFHLMKESYSGVLPLMEKTFTVSKNSYVGLYQWIIQLFR